MAIQIEAIEQSLYVVLLIRSVEKEMTEAGWTWDQIQHWHSLSVSWSNCQSVSQLSISQSVDYAVQGDSKKESCMWHCFLFSAVD